MAWWIQVREIADAEGQPTGKFRKTAKSDEDGGGPFGLCDHEHETIKEAENCPDAKSASQRF